MKGCFDFRKATDVEQLKKDLLEQLDDVVSKFLGKARKAPSIVLDGLTWKERSASFKKSGQNIEVWVHLVPPCSTFSNARDRRATTRVISMDHPGSFHHIGKRNTMVMNANLMARISIQLARWLHDDLGAHVSLENPDMSYLWLCGVPLFGTTKKYRDVRTSYCMSGNTYQKNTHFRVWGKAWAILGRCARSNMAYSHAGR